MKIPKQLKIGGHIYKVILTPDGFGDSPCATTDYNKGEIKINSALLPSEMEQSVIHEAMHVMNKTIYHPLLDSLSEQFYQFLKDNNLLK